MALLAWDGLDSYDSVSTFIIARPEFYISPSGIEYFSTIGRFGRVGLQSNSLSNWESQLVYCNFPATVNDVWTGRAWKLNAVNTLHMVSGAATNLVTSAAPALEVGVFTETDGRISIYRGRAATLLANTSPGTLVANRWYYIETRMNVHPTTGTVEVWLDNQKVLEYTGNTKNSPAATANSFVGVGVWGGGGQGGNSAVFDDFYVLDTTGPAPWNTRLGDIRIATLVPGADVPGANTGTQSTGTTHWGVVDEIPPNSTDYVTLQSTAGNIERFYVNNALTLGSVPNVVYGVAAVGRASKSDAGVANIAFNIIPNNSTFMINSSSKILSTTSAVYRQDYTTNPATSSQWTAANIANVQVGVTTVA